MRFHCLLHTLLNCARLATAVSFSYTGSTVQLGDSYYFIDPEVAGTIPLPSPLSANGSLDLVPVTVVSDAGQAAGDVQTLAEKWSAKDDVFHEAFLANGLFTGGTAAESPNASRRRADAALPPGPYFAHPTTGQVHRVYRLYDDFSNSFTASLLQKRDSSFQTLAGQAPAAGSLSIGVPSRLYYTRTEAQPLAGVRIGIKDLYNLKGVKQSNANRAWYHLYPPAEETSPVIQRLIDAGAVIVGFQMLAQFANGDTFTADFVDLHSPFNPRGDGYQIPSGSSSGAGASIASYDWLDVAIGSDTGGSVRGPAQVSGLFGNRPTHGAASLDLVTPLAPSMDTAGAILRDPELWDSVLAVMYGGNYTSLTNVKKQEYPSKIYTFAFPDDSVGADVTTSFGDFIAAAANVTGAEVEEIDIDALWNETHPEEAGEVTLEQLLDTTYVTFTTKEQGRLVRDPFFADYAAKHDGRTPYVNPSARTRWEHGDTIPQSELDAAHRNQTLFADWFNTRVLSRTNGTACSSALLLYPGLLPRNTPRDTYRGQVSPPPYGLYASRMSSYSGTPDIVLPLGEVYRASNVTGEEELLPVTVDAMAARGCDGLLTRLAIELVREGSVVVPKTGGTLDGGEILFKRADMFGF